MNREQIDDISTWIKNHDTDSTRHPNLHIDALAAGIARHGKDWLRSDEAKRILWPILDYCYRMPEEIVLEKEWCRLVDTIGPRCSVCNARSESRLCDSCKEEKEEDDLIASRRSDLDSHPDREF